MKVELKVWLCFRNPFGCNSGSSLLRSHGFNSGNVPLCYVWVRLRSQYEWFLMRIIGCKGRIATACYPELYERATGAAERTDPIAYIHVAHLKSDEEYGSVESEVSGEIRIEYRNNRLLSVRIHHRELVTDKITIEHETRWGTSVRHSGRADHKILISIWGEQFKCGCRSDCAHDYGVDSDCARVSTDVTVLFVDVSSSQVVHMEHTARVDSLRVLVVNTSASREQLIQDVGVSCSIEGYEGHYHNYGTHDLCEQERDGGDSVCVDDEGVRARGGHGDGYNLVLVYGFGVTRFYLVRSVSVLNRGLVQRVVFLGGSYGRSGRYLGYFGSIDVAGLSLSVRYTLVIYGRDESMEREETHGEVIRTRVGARRTARREHTYGESVGLSTSRDISVGHGARICERSGGGDSGGLLASVDYEGGVGDGRRSAQVSLEHSLTGERSKGRDVDQMRLNVEVTGESFGIAGGGGSYEECCTHLAVLGVHGCMSLLRVLEYGINKGVTQESLEYEDITVTSYQGSESDDSSIETHNTHSQRMQQII
ncbi:hypothetical protein Tco_1407341 [Tanacetum coccineum]